MSPDSAPNELQLFIDEDMPAPRVFALAGGEAVVYSACAPDRQSGNQDGAAVLPIDPGQGVLAVADGLGGQPGGADAARLTLEALRDGLSQREAASNARAVILDAIEAGNRAVLELGIGAGTTLAAVEILVDTLRPYHVGDSEILVVGQRGRVKLQTVAHSPVGYALEAGMLDRDEALHHDDRYVVSNVVGSASMRIEVGSPLPLARRDTVLLATDGLFDNLQQDEIVDLIRIGPLGVAAGHLVQAALSRMREQLPGKPSKPDDLTFILFRRSS